VHWEPGGVYSGIVGEEGDGGIDGERVMGVLGLKGLGDVSLQILSSPDTRLGYNY